MEINRVKYNRKYLRDIALMMAKTWSYEKHFEGLKNSEFFYRQLFQCLYLNNNYSEFLVDSDDRLIALLVAGHTKTKSTLREKWLLFLNFIYLLMGKYGNRSTALKVIECMGRVANLVMKDKKLYDAEISLFFVNEKCRGFGVGKKMMNNYMEYCRCNSTKSVVLLTDSGCNYGFYDKYGFKRVNEINGNSELEKNVFSYAINVPEDRPTEYRCGNFAFNSATYIVKVESVNCRSPSAN